MTNPRVLCAPDSFKESLSAHDAAIAMASGVCHARPEATVDLCPIADGGEGTVATMQAAMNGQPRTTRVTGPLGAPVDATWCIIHDDNDRQRTAIIEMAAAAGLHLVPPAQRDPTRTTTFGVGQLIRAAIDASCAHIIVGIGGSATCDGGIGMAQALGVRFTHSDGSISDETTTPLTGASLQRLVNVDLLDRVALPPITVACDVRNPLVGPNGAAAIFGPQKGASLNQVLYLDDGLTNLARRLPRVDAAQRGAGAAGGLGYGLVAMADATLKPGIELILDAVGFDERVKDATLVLTGEGRLDAQSLSGKVVDGVVHAATRHGVPVVAIVGTVDPDLDVNATGLAATYAIDDVATSRDDAFSRASFYLADLAAEALRATS